MTTPAELAAAEAEALPAFSPLKLAHIRAEVTRLLSLVGTAGFFDEYSRHDITHIDAMLSSLDWLIPDSTKAVMTPTDWLLIVLSIYFHDVGLLVTREEFARRAESTFPLFKEELFTGSSGRDYEGKIDLLPDDEAERFLYQEFVREHHAARARAWVSGQAVSHWGVAVEGATEVVRLLQGLPPQFRRDLALVCESHHLDDLGEFSKYKVSQPYGRSDAEVANVQYAALVLRVADLLHITSDRTPSIMFRIIHPADPVSQQEWAKQMAVTAVRPKMGADREGNPSPTAPRDTIAVFAYFTEETGFFGLTQYLVYAAREIRKAADWARAANSTQAAPHELPWRYIDDTNVETEGFLRETFAFDLDQARILDLLTGHTLYNDTRVVLRELVQNSLDAVRLRQVDEARGGRSWDGEVAVMWDPDQRVLAVRDNGTGMTQTVIEDHLLKVGASRYQDPAFREQYPEFSAISRFGIGVLSTFMIADAVEIITAAPEETEARHLTLRSVHGRYLIKLLAKEMEPAASLGGQGTLIRLHVRASADVEDVVETMRQWIVVPRATVSVSISGEEPIRVGFPNVAAALASELEIVGISIGDQRSDRPIEIRQVKRENVDVAFAVEWNPYFREWGFVRLADLARAPRPHSFFLGVCVEGIRVEFGTPGYSGFRIASIANAVGLAAPKTNVARSGLELTPERDELLRNLYRAYCGHVGEEIEKLAKERGFSLTWSAEEARFLLSPLALKSQERESPALSDELLLEEASNLPTVIIEESGYRKAITPAELARLPEFWTVDSQFFQSAEGLLREVPGSTSLGELMTALRATETRLPDGPMICRFQPQDATIASALTAKEVKEVVVDQKNRRVDLRWGVVGDVQLWELLGPVETRSVFRSLSTVSTRRLVNIYVALQEIPIRGLTNEIGVRTFGAIYLLPAIELRDYFKAFAERVADTRAGERGVGNEIIGDVIFRVVTTTRFSDVAEVSDYVERRMRDEAGDAHQLEIISSLIEPTSLIAALETVRAPVFDSSAWVRGSGLDEA